MDAKAVGLLGAVSTIATAGAAGVGAMRLHALALVLAVVGELGMVGAVCACTVAIMPRVGGLGSRDGDEQHRWLVRRLRHGYVAIRWAALLVPVSLWVWVAAAVVHAAS